MPMLSSLFSRTNPIEEFVSGWVGYPHTPDYAVLEEQQRHHVFVYNEVMTGHRSHNKFITEDTIALGTAFTQEYKLSLWTKKLGNASYPVALEGPRTTFAPHISSSRRLVDMTNHDRLNRGVDVKLGRIKGELYSFRPEQLKELDSYMRNMEEFERKKVKTVIFYYKHFKTSDEFIRCAYIIRAWMYVGRAEYWNPLLDGGYLFSLASRHQAPSATSNLSDYYHYDVQSNSR